MLSNFCMIESGAQKTTIILGHSNTAIVILHNIGLVYSSPYECKKKKKKKKKGPKPILLVTVVSLVHLLFLRAPRFCVFS
jgi:hypothetical protein